MAFGNVRISLSACRVNAGLSQIELAEILGVAKTTVSNWEKGITIPSFDQVRRISEVSGIPMDFIFLAEQSKNLGDDE